MAHIPAKAYRGGVAPRDDAACRNLCRRSADPRGVTVPIFGGFQDTILNGWATIHWKFNGFLRFPRDRFSTA
jgi:hypothetical protein